MGDYFRASLAVYGGHSSTEADNAFSRWKKSEGVAEDGALDFYENWPDLPNNAYLIDIHYGPKGGVSSGGFYWTGPEKISKEFNYRGAGKGEVRIVFKQDAYDGLRVKRKEQEEFVSLIATAVRAMYAGKGGIEEGQASCMSLVSVIGAINHSDEEFEA